MQFDHIGVIVHTLREGRDLLGGAIGVDKWTDEVSDEGIGVHVQFGMGDHGPCYELIAPIGSDSPVSRALRQGINVLNHVAYLTPNLQAEAQRIMRQGFVPLSVAQPAVAYGGAHVQFFASESRLMLELIEAPGHLHRYR